MMKVDVGSIGCHAKLVFLFLLSYSWCDVGHCHKSPLAVVNPLDIVSEKIFFGSCLNYHELLQLTELPSKFLKKNSPISSITSNLNSSCSESLKQIGSALFSNSSQTKTYAHQSKFKAVAILPSTAIYPQRLFCRELFVIGQF